MKNKIFSIFTIVCIYLLSSVSSAQVNIKDNDINAFFVKKEDHVTPGKTFFNIFTIQNKTNRVITLLLSINLPYDWNLIGSRTQKLTIQSNSEITLPIRVGVSNNTKGGVGYAVTAVISDESGNNLRSEYCFLKVPVESAVSIKTVKKSRYFEQKTQTSSFLLKIKNEGNIDENININVFPDKTIKLLNKDNEYSTDNIYIKPHSDTTIQYKVKLKRIEGFDPIRLHKAKINFKGLDTLIYKTVWFNYLDWQFENFIPESDRPLVFELLAQNLFANSNPSYLTRFYGSVLLPKKKRITYLFETLNRSNNENKYNYWVNSRLFASYRAEKLEVTAGDFSGNFAKNMYGRGIFAKYKINRKNELRAIANKRVVTPVYNYGFAYKHHFSSVHLEAGAAYTDDKKLLNNDKLAFAGLGFSLLTNHTINIQYAMSQTSASTVFGHPELSGYGFNLDYTGKVGLLNARVRTNYGTPGFSGINSGRLYVNSSLDYRLTNTSSVNFYYIKQKYQPRYFIDNAIRFDRYSNLEHYKIQYNKSITNTTLIFGGSHVYKYNSNSFATYNPNDNFSVLSGKLELGFRYRQRLSNNSVSMLIRYGYSKIYEFSNVLNETHFPKTNDDIVSGFEATSNVKVKNSGVYIGYKHGPVNIQQFYAFIYNFNFAKSIFIIPYYNKELIKNRLFLLVRGSVISNLTSKINRLTLSPQLNLKLGRGWSFRFLGTYSAQTVVYDATKGSSTHSSTYFEFGLKKVFNWNQPRVKYHNYDAIFYKDLNGNRHHDENEPGVGNVLVDIIRANPEADSKDPNYNGEFRMSELLSNPNGKISYINMPQGDYIINYTPQNDNQGNYIVEGSEKDFRIAKDTIMYIPFMEKNKVYGKVVLNRAKHSGLGEIPLDNIKIIVRGNGKTYSDLTDKNGNFELYIPVTDYYTVTINNIFYENFDLRQEFFQVKFNGYKQFEVNFEFDEKQRKVVGLDDTDFSVDDDDEKAIEDVKKLHQTNLKGVVKRAVSLSPIHATVTITNAETGELITQIASSMKTGAFFTNFYTTERYKLKVEAKGYWTQTEVVHSDRLTTFENVTRNFLMSKIKKNEILATNNLTFEKLSTKLSPQAKGELQNLIIKFAKNPNVQILIKGYTDNKEALTTDAVLLSEDRAKAVMKYLTANGIIASRLQIRGMGDKTPAVSNDNETGRTLNRRVEFEIVGF